MLTIGKLAGIRDTLRYYEREGLIEPAGKSPAGSLLVLRGRDAARCGDVRKRAIEKKRQLESKIRS